MPKRTDINSIMIIGAGPIVIGQACEFDYSGAQACKALREEGYRVILVNCAAVAGHCQIGDDVIIGGLSGIHQWVRIGEGAIIGAVTMVTNDVIPFGLVQAPRGELDGLNLVGLKRRGVARQDITALRAAYQMLAQGDGAFMDRAKRLGAETESEYVRQIVDFVLADSDRSFLTPR